MRHLVQCVLGVVCCAYFWAATPGVPITIGETVQIPSKVLGETRTILISAPANYASGTERYPVLYMTDGDAHVTHSRGTADFLSRNGLMPNLIVVGIANTNRTRDLSPTHASIKTPDGKVQEIPNSGGAPKFLEFFEKELFPYVESRYRTAPYRIFAGHSLGGLLALHVLATRAEMFNAYVAASPAPNWDDDYPIRALESYFKDRKACNHALFVCMANEEEGDAKPSRFDRLVALLGGVKADGFEWGSALMADEDHASVVLRAHYMGLRKIFDGWRLPTDPKTHLFEGGEEGQIVERRPVGNVRRQQGPRGRGGQGFEKTVEGLRVMRDARGVHGSAR